MQVKVMPPMWKWILSENVIKQEYNYKIQTPEVDDSMYLEC